MKYFLTILILIAVGGFFAYKYAVTWYVSQNVEPAKTPIEITNTVQDATEASTIETVLAAMPDVAIIAENLTIPWDIVFLTPDELLITERVGTLVRLNLATNQTVSIDVPDVIHKGEGGLLGIVLDPAFSQNRYIYLYLSSSQTEGESTSVNKVIRYQYVDDTLTSPKVIVDDIPGSLYHDGGRMSFGPDGYLYVTTGDAGVPNRAQDLNSLSGKILRVTDEGDIPQDNPFPESPIYAYGSRNAQGLAWDGEANLWSTEHGRTNATQTGMDEINVIQPGKNYGWPDSEGDRVVIGTEGPKLHSGPSKTWAPASALYYDNSLFFGGLRGEALYEAVLRGTEVVALKEHFKGEYGRIRTVVRGPDGAFYMTTSNRDARGTVREGDDKIIRINPLQFKKEN